MAVPVFCGRMDSSGKAWSILQLGVERVGEVKR